MVDSNVVLSGTTDKSYTFLDVTECNMCGASADDSVVLGMRLNQSQGLRPK